MKIIAVLNADFVRGPLGTASRLNDDLLGETVVRRTMKRLLAARKVTSVHLLVDASQERSARESAAGLDVAVETHNAGPVPWRALIACSRKWAIDAWRGGISDATVFDESNHPWALSTLASREKADGVVDIPASAPLLDPVLLDAMIDHYETVREDMRLTFTQSAPGLSAAIYMPTILADLANGAQPPGRLMSYLPAKPQRDLTLRECFYPVEDTVAHVSGRCVADTAIAIHRIERILCDCGGSTDGSDSTDDDRFPNAMTVSRWLAEHRYDETPALPAEVEIELTTDDPLGATTLRPRGQAVGKRGAMAEDLFDRLIDELAERDDMRIVLGGFGDPLLHPNWAHCVDRCRKANIFGVAVRTPAVHLDAKAIDILIEAKVDVINVLLDAVTPETYQRVHHADYYEQVIGNIDRLFEAHGRAQQPQPLIVCEMIKTRETMPEMEAFYDHWLSKIGSVCLTGPSTYAGQWPNLAVMSMAPPKRFPCLRLFNRAMVLADGSVTVCDQDFRGKHAIGSVREVSLGQLWKGEVMTGIRSSHRQATYDAMPFCSACDEWHRP